MTEQVERKARVLGSYVMLPDPDGGYMVWPDPEAAGDLEYQLRYGPELTREKQLLAAGVLAAYRYLFEIPQRIRNQRVSEIKSASRPPEDPHDN